MKRAQWITIGGAILLTILLYTTTKDRLFGERKVKTTPPVAHVSHEGLSTDSVLYYSKRNLTKEQVERLNQLENGISRGDVAAQKLTSYHQLAHFWADSAKLFAPYAFYTGEAARLENSEKSLTFAAHLFLDNLTNEEDPRLKQWEAFQAKDLFERSLKLNPSNDSSKVGLGATYLFGGIEMPMQGIQMIRDVVQKDPTNVYAQMTLGRASVLSGQMDKAVERFQTVIKMQPANAEAVLLLADTYDRMNNKPAAIEWYEKSLPLIPNPEYKSEVTKRINELKK
ncbi:MAG: tetratricopeptide repeat protein [Candidatus Dadabacteria bacterium]